VDVAANVDEHALRPVLRHCYHIALDIKIKIKEK
jgi:hypothetical protein